MCSILPTPSSVESGLDEIEENIYMCVLNIALRL